MRYWINLMVAVALLFWVTPAPVQAVYPGDDQSPEVTLDPYLDSITPIVSQIDNWESGGNQMTTIPYVDGQGNIWRLNVNFNTRGYSLFDSQNLPVGSGYLSVADSTALYNHVGNQDPVIGIVCGGLCIAILAVIVAAALSGAGYLIARDMECNDMYQNALRSLATEGQNCIAQTPPGDGRKWVFEIQLMPSTQICGSVGYGNCVLR